MENYAQGSPITAEEMKKLVENYANTIKKGEKAKDKDGNDVNEQTKWVWYSKSGINKLFNILETQSDEKDENKIGIKIYFGVYGKGQINSDPDNLDFPDHKDFDFTGRLTVGLAPAVYKGQNQIEDIGPETEVNGNEGLSLSTDLENSNLNPDPEPYYNKGNMCPPEC